jgi:hypothetical protein
MFLPQQPQFIITFNNELPKVAHSIWRQCYRTFYRRKLWIFVISWQAFQPSLMFVGKVRALPK